MLATALASAGSWRRGLGGGHDALTDPDDDDDGEGSHAGCIPWGEATSSSSVFLHLPNGSALMGCNFTMWDVLMHKQCTGGCDVGDDTEGDDGDWHTVNPGGMRLPAEIGGLGCHHGCMFRIRAHEPWSTFSNASAPVVTEAPPGPIPLHGARFEMKLVPPIPRGSLAGAEEFARAFAKAVMLPEKRVVLTDVSSTGQFVTLDMMPDTNVYRYVSCDTECVLDKCERLCGIVEAAGHRIDHRFGVRSTRPPSVAKHAQAGTTRLHLGDTEGVKALREVEGGEANLVLVGIFAVCAALVVVGCRRFESWFGTPAPGSPQQLRRTHQRLRQKEEDWFESIGNSLGM